MSPWWAVCTKVVTFAAKQIFSVWVLGSVWLLRYVSVKCDVNQRRFSSAPMLHFITAFIIILTTLQGLRIIVNDANATIEITIRRAQAMDAEACRLFAAGCLLQRCFQQDWFDALWHFFFFWWLRVRLGDKWRPKETNRRHAWLSLVDFFPLVATLMITLALCHCH